MVISLGFWTHSKDPFSPEGRPLDGWVSPYSIHHRTTSAHGTYSPLRDGLAQPLGLSWDGCKLALELGHAAVIELIIVIKAVCDAFVAKKISLFLEISEFRHKGVVVTKLLKYIYQLFQQSVGIVLVDHLEWHLVPNALFGEFQCFSNVELQLFFNELTTRQGMSNFQIEVVFGRCHMQENIAQVPGWRKGGGVDGDPRHDEGGAVQGLEVVKLSIVGTFIAIGIAGLSCERASASAW